MTPATRRRLARGGSAYLAGLACYVAVLHFVLDESWLSAVLSGVIVIGFVSVAVAAWIGQDRQHRQRRRLR